MSTGKKFTRKQEDFICEVCGMPVKGNGYTDHCPSCLWSKHVDTSPGNRQAKCGGLMKPVTARQEHGEWKLRYHCQSCGYKRKNKAAKNDSFDQIIRLSTLPETTN